MNDFIFFNPFGFSIGCRITPYRTHSSEEVERCKPFSKQKVSNDPAYYLEVLSKQMHKSVEDTVSILKSVNAVNPGAMLSILLMTVAKEFDKFYNNHISEASELYCYDTTSSKIFKLTHTVKKSSFRYFAAFRSIEGAKIGITIVNTIRNFIFTNDGK